jgi:four helix bundle protein
MESVRQKPAKSFRDMRVWQAAYDLALEIYKLCETFPKREQYGLISQMCRAAVSVCSNIAEGFEKRTINEKNQFYSIANGSLTELENQLLIARGVGYIKGAQFSMIGQKCVATHRMLVVLRKVNQEKGAS